MIDQYLNNLLKGAHSASNPADRVVPTRAARFRAVVRPSYYNNNGFDFTRPFQQFDQRRG